jgi:ribonucleoside-diphosphate reductase alpha chain
MNSSLSSRNTTVKPAVSYDFSQLQVVKRDGRVVPFDHDKVIATLKRATQGLIQVSSYDVFLQELSKVVFDEITTQELEKALMLTLVAFIEKDPVYSTISAAVLLQRVYKEVAGFSIKEGHLGHVYREKFIEHIKRGVDAELLSPELLTFDLPVIAQALDIARDGLFQYIGMQTLYERYFLKDGKRVIETPQAFWMRVAMGLALREEHKTEKAIEFYDALSSLRFISSTPTLFHAGTLHPQLSSCFLTYIDDDLDHIFKSLKDNAHISKWSGGLSNSWTSIRSTGTPIKSIKVSSQGTVPFLKLANDVVSAINRSGSRRGATCAYLEAWHLDFEDFLDLRRNTGDERRRTHDMNTASWVPDLFMKRVEADESWTLFSPHETPDLHELYGVAFEKAYEMYEEKVAKGEIKFYKTISARQLWRKMLSRLFETGHPWITFKDACNVRSPQDHAGVIHSSNLCTEITLNTSVDESAVCNIGSVNLQKHVINGKVDHALLSQTIKTAIRMLDNVIDINFYPTKEAKNSNLKHRPIGLGLMGFQDALYLLDIPFDSENARSFSDNIMEFISYHAILSSSKLAQERGAYSSFKGSKWDRNLLPLDTIDLLEKERGQAIGVSRTSTIDWNPVREHIKQYGMRNSNTMAIAPTATISNIAGCFPCIEPIYKNIYVKANMSGEFTVVNHYLVNDLKKLELWNQEMLDLLKYYDGNIQAIQNIPQHIKDKYKEAFEIDPEWLIDVSAVRMKWIDQSQSHNVFMRGVSGKKMNDIYMHAWKMGLKTMYYLRTLGASQIEKATLDASRYGFTQKREYTDASATASGENEDKETEATFIGGMTSRVLCSIENEACESCQ